MTKYGLRAKVITLTLAPTLIIGVLLSLYFINRQYQDIEQKISLTGFAIIEPLAIASEIGLNNESRESVRRLIGHTHQQHSQFIRTIAVFSDQNELFVTSNYHRDLEALAFPKGKKMPTHVNVQYQNERLLFYAPIRVIGGFNSRFRKESPIGYVVMEMDLLSFQLEKYEEMVSAAVVLIFGMILSGIFAYRLLYDVEIPINQMLSMIDKIRRGHLDVRIEGKFVDKLDTLKKGINAMAISLSQYHLEMQQSIDQATSDLRGTLEQLEIQNIELDIAKKNALEATKIKSVFIANMSHELRTPLNGILGFTRQILKTQLTSNQEDHLQTIEKSANNLLSIINDILDFSKLEANKLLLEKIPFDVEQTLDEVMEQLALMAHEKGLELYLHVDPKISMELIGDPKRIQQVLTNLIGNAAKFTAQGHISVRVELKHQNDKTLELEFVIRDTGIGISEEQQTQLFQAFNQADASINRRYGGTGLGLVITQKLIQQMGGTVGLSSHLHRGSSFWFTLPFLKTKTASGPVFEMSAYQQKPLLIIDENSESRLFMTTRLIQLGFSILNHSTLPKVQTDVLGVLFFIQTNKVPSLDSLIDKIKMAKKFSQKVIFCLPTTELVLFDQLLNAGATACLANPLSRKKLIEQFCTQSDLKNIAMPFIEKKKSLHPVLEKAPLVVMALDDNPANLKLIKTLLQERVTHVVTAGDGQEAVFLAKKQRFDLILMDIQMPVLDGVLASKQIRKTALNAKTPIVAVTANAQEGERERLLAQGMDDYLSKPIDEQMLERVLSQWTLFPKTETLYVLADVKKTALTQQSIDWKESIKQAGGKESLAREMLEMLLVSFSEVKNLLEEALEGKIQEEPLLWMIHKLHGSCAYCGVLRLKKLCNEIEFLLQQKKTIQSIEPELFELLDEIENVEKSASLFLVGEFGRE